MVADAQEVSDEGIYLPDELVTMELPDWGRVFAVGADIEDLSVGDVVICAPGAGKFIEHFLDLVPLAQFLGDESEGGVSVPVGYDYHALGRLEEMTLTPLGGNVLIERSGYAEMIGELHVPDDYGNRDGVATVLEVGAKVSGCKPGDRVVYRAGGIVPLDLPKRFEEAYGAKAGTLAFMPETAILSFVHG